MTAKILDGKKTAADLRDKIGVHIKRAHITPTLAVVIVGDDPASHIYVNNKQKAAEAIGIKSIIHRLDDNISQSDLDTLISGLNQDTDINGILVQMPLPKHLSEADILEKISPQKDVDGFHIMNIGKLHGASAGRSLLPCTPMGCMLLLSQVKNDLSGLHAVVIGRSHIVGRPMGELLLQKNATVTITHSRTKNIEAVVKQADIIVAAVGIAGFVKADWVKKDAIILDVGINRTALDNGKSKVVGDVDFDNVKDKSSAITPVPGGVGPMTIACLLFNTVAAYYMQSYLKSGDSNVSNANNHKETLAALYQILV